MSANQLGAEGVDAFAGGRGLPALKRLVISRNVWSDRTEPWTDWDGSVTGEGPAYESLSELEQRFTARPGVKLG